MPINTKDEFFIQFKLDETQYIDNNNYLRLNKGSGTHNRFNPFAAGYDFSIIDCVMGVPWNSKAFTESIEISYDGGNNFIKENAQQLFGTYFFMSEDIMFHSKNLYSITDLLSDFGGLY